MYDAAVKYLKICFFSKVPEPVKEEKLPGFVGHFKLLQFYTLLMHFCVL